MVRTHQWEVTVAPAVGGDFFVRARGRVACGGAAGRARDGALGIARRGCLRIRGDAGVTGG